LVDLIDPATFKVPGKITLAESDTAPDLEKW
jgi:hypothetical protein